MIAQRNVMDDATAGFYFVLYGGLDGDVLVLNRELLARYPGPWEIGFQVENVLAELNVPADLIEAMAAFAPQDD